MSDEFKEFQEAPAPVLTFGTPEVQKEEPLAVKEQQKEPAEKAEPQLTEDILTDAEKKMVDDFSRQINLHDSNGILQYGVGTQKKMADFSESALKNVRTKDLGEVGDMISSLVTELKSFDVDEEEKGFLGLFKKSANKVTAMKAKYEKAEVNVEKICEVLENHQMQLMKDVAVLDKMYGLNLSYFKELSMYILAGKKRLQEVRATELAELIDKANRSNLPEDEQAAKDLESLCDRFEKKLHDLELTRMIAIQTAPQIRLVIALGVEHANQAARAQREVTDMTNELLRKNADALKVATVESAKASERGIVDIETLKATNASLISTFDEVIRIQEDGRQKRRVAEEELNRMELELKNKLLEIHR